MMSGLGLPWAVQWRATLYSPWSVVTLCSLARLGGQRTEMVMVCSSLPSSVSARQRYSPSSDRLEAQLRVVNSSYSVASQL